MLAIKPTIRPAHVTAWLLCLGCLCGCGRVESIRAPWLIPTTQTPSDQWSAHRGGTLHGVAQTSALPTEFDAGRNVRWSWELPGDGHSSPIVFGQRVFLTAQVATDPMELVVLCVDRPTGTLRWSRSVGPPAGPTHRRNGYASATVATDGERIYATFTSRGLFCFTVEGEPLWQLPLDDWEHPWGQASSPILSGNLVIQLADGARHSRLLAVNCYTGEQVWSTPRASTGCWTTPVLVPVQDEGQLRWEIVVNGTGSTNGTPGHVIAYAPETGQELWRVQGTTDIPCPTAIVGDSLVVSTSGRNGPILAIRPGGRGDITQTQVVWRRPRGGPQVPTGLIARDHLYLLTDNGVLRCLQVATGEKVWERRLQGRFSASLVLGDSKLFAVSEGGDIHVISADDQGTVLAVNHLQQPCFATPAIADGDLLVRTDQRLYCFAAGQPLAADPPPLEADTDGVALDAVDAMDEVQFPASYTQPE